MSIGQAIAMHMALERQRQLTVGKSSVSHLSQASTIPVHRVCLRSRSERQLAINAALPLESEPSLCTTQVPFSKTK